MSTATATVGKFVWHEQVSGEPKKAQDFDGRLFGWGVEEMPGPGGTDYAMIAAKRPDPWRLRPGHGGCPAAPPAGAAPRPD